MCFSNLTILDMSALFALNIKKILTFILKEIHLTKVNIFKKMVSGIMILVRFVIFILFFIIIGVNVLMKILHCFFSND